MLLSKLLSEINYKKNFLKNNKKIDVNYISTNSKLIKNNSIFITNFKKKIKKAYIEEAITKGANAIITNKKIYNLKIPQFIVKNLSLTTKKLVEKLKPFPPRNIIGITGTNGKTSVVWYLSCMLNSISLNSSSLGTLGYFKNFKYIKDSFLTTPEWEEIYQLAYSNKKNKNNFIFEVSSHAISKERIKNIPINIAALTNITQDHLDFHKTFLNYRKTKFKLFSKFLSNKGTAILNEKIPRIKSLKQSLKKKSIKIITYGKKTSNINCYKKSKKIYIKIYNLNTSIYYNLDTDFEIENLACSISCCVALGISPKKITKSILNISKPKGRMEFVNSLNNGAKVFIDYAHTPDALKNILISMTNKKYKPNLVFGCGGERDKNKRKKMGIIANKFANEIYITDDNPRNEKPELIRKQIHDYCLRAINIGDRKKGIKTAIQNLKSNRKLIIAGKGHEKKQIKKNKIISFDDFKIANQLILEINNKKK